MKLNIIWVLSVGLCGYGLANLFKAWFYCLEIKSEPFWVMVGIGIVIMFLSSFKDKGNGINN